MRESFLEFPESTRHEMCKDTLTANGGLEGTLAYFEHVQKSTSSALDVWPVCRSVSLNSSCFNVDIQHQCPTPGVQCGKIEFKNIKIFYHYTYPPSMCHSTPDSWNFYIARPGTGPQDCIDWEKAGIKISLFNQVRKWVPLNVLLVLPGDTVRIEFPRGSSQSDHVVVFPWTSDALPDNVEIHDLKVI